MFGGTLSYTVFAIYTIGGKRNGVGGSEDIFLGDLFGSVFRGGIVVFARGVGLFTFLWGLERIAMFFGNRGTIANMRFAIFNRVGKNSVMLFAIGYSRYLGHQGG